MKKPKSSQAHASTDGSKALVELSSRVVFSLLKAAARSAMRFNLSMDRLLELAQLAYFEELRRKSPRDLSGIAKRLGLSLRSVSNLNRRYKEDFFAPELEIEPLRKITAVLLKGPASKSEISSALKNISEDEIDRALRVLLDQDFIVADKNKYKLEGNIRSFVSDVLQRRVDGLNHQMDILADSVWSRFAESNDQTAVGRSWAFAARPADVRAFIEETTKSLRHQAIDLEEEALKTSEHSRFGVTIAIAPIKEEEPHE